MGKRRKDTKRPRGARSGRDPSAQADGTDGGGGKRKTARADRPSWYATHGRDLRFLFVFGMIIGAYYLSTTFSVVREGFFPWYLDLNARASARILNAVGYDNVSSDGRNLASPMFSIRIERGCDAIEPSALFVAAVLASPVVFRRKIPAVVLGSALLLLLNLVRIVTLYLTGLHYKSLFDMMHLDVWQAAFIILAILFWAGWASWVGRTPVRQPHATT